MNETNILKLVKRIEDMHPYKVSGKHDTFCKYNEAWSSCCDLFETILLQLIEDKE